ncbi:FAD dependent oxidoreductase [Pseudomassariella vexata]|uniref:FAD dependent oxidoreductase n=1 Tax=Pseudomassariella vexata TaxID=1141098 RepID=A0A1Y2DGM0_9PEZI|nr:FAD dependent oxidoreductase [Pseudomassariella vexata]ORY58398.1 FAD dependent oxidoreductase [Pseudomassariella vexata]
MEQRAAIPVSLPRADPTQSYWQDPPDDIADLRSTEALPQSADIVIIGSGISGAAVAWNLFQNGTHDILMLEARQACSGATGRNGGHTKAASYRSFLHHAKEYGTDAAAQIARLELDNIRAVHAFTREHSIPCDSYPCDTIDVIYDRAQWEHGQRAIQAMRDAMPGHPAAEYTLYSLEEVQDKFYCGKGGDESVCGGIVYEAGSLSGYKLGIGVLKLCLDRRLNLQTNTPALALEKTDDGKWKVETPRGSIIAAKVVLATNGYTAHLLKRFQGLIVPTRGHVTAQRPGQNMPSEGLATTYSFIYDKGFEYMIPRPKGTRFEGDIVIGGGLFKAPENGLMENGTTDDTEADNIIQEFLYECLPSYFGDNWGEDHPDGRIRKQWTGIMGYSPDGVPFVGEVSGEKNLWMSCSFQGHGMVLCWMCAKALACMMDGRDDAELKGWFPDAFRISEKRMGSTFQGLLHVTAEEAS